MSAIFVVLLYLVTGGVLVRAGYWVHWLYHRVIDCFFCPRRHSFSLVLFHDGSFMTTVCRLSSASGCIEMTIPGQSQPGLSRQDLWLQVQALRLCIIGWDLVDESSPFRNCTHKST